MKLWEWGVIRLLSRPDVVINVNCGSCSRSTKVSNIIIIGGIL